MTWRDMGCNGGQLYVVLAFSFWHTYNFIYSVCVLGQIINFEGLSRWTLRRTDVWFWGGRGAGPVDNHIDYVRVSRVDGCENQMLSKSRVSLLDRPSASIRPTFWSLPLRVVKRDCNYRLNVQTLWCSSCMLCIFKLQSVRSTKSEISPSLQYMVEVPKPSIGLLLLHNLVIILSRTPFFDMLGSQRQI